MGELRLYADYGLTGGLDAARAALLAHPEHPKVVIAASDVLFARGEDEEAVAALDAAWETLPGDWELRGARLRRGLSVGLPGDDQPEEQELLDEGPGLGGLPLVGIPVELEEAP